MKDQANDQAQQGNMPMDQFEGPESQSESSSGQGPENPNAKPSKGGKTSGKPDKNKPKKDKNARHGVFEDSGDDEDWFKMKNETATGAEVDSLDDVPADYRGLVRDYFDALNKGGKKK